MYAKHKRNSKPSGEMKSEGLWFQIIFFKKRRCEKGVDTNLQTLAHLVNNPQLYGIVGTVDDIADGRFGHTTFHIQLILCHVPFIQQFREALAYRLI